MQLEIQKVKPQQFEHNSESEANAEIV